MASKSVIASQYRKAKCCGTCLYEKARYCSRLCMPVSPEYVCDGYEDDPKRAARKIACKDCRFGMSGDRTCGTGCGNAKTPKSCYSGRSRTA